MKYLRCQHLRSYNRVAVDSSTAELKEEGSAVKRFYGWLKPLKRITIKYEKLVMVYKASIIIHLRYGI